VKRDPVLAASRKLIDVRRGYKPANMPDKPAVTAVTEREGGEWIPWAPYTTRLVHAIRFDDGSEFDAHNGWRSKCGMSR
jgi:hypothetical protein